LLGDSFNTDNLAGKSDFERVAVAVQVPALAIMVWDTVAGIELQPAGDQHIEKRSKNEPELYHSSLPETAFSGSIGSMSDNKPPLTATNHSRDSAGLSYVYPVVSRRAGGVSVGINLNTNNACNWRCIYCQVPNLRRGSAPPVDLPLLEKELRGFLNELLHGSFMRENVPPEARRLNDIALSGNGEPTSAAEFEQVIELIGRVMDEFSLKGKIKLILITNGSLIHRPAVRNGIRKMALLSGEVWFKLDSATAQGRMRINHSRQTAETALRNLRVAASLCPTWIQTATFVLDGQTAPLDERQAYLQFLARCQDEGIPLQGVLLYGLARPSLQPEAPRLSKPPSAWLEAFASEIRQQGLAVKLSA
jgi:wyosine [tRNA(Phe)-imidazoG37] synthetase (radical SAM superfamily)